MSVYDYISDENEIKRFKRRINNLNDNIDYHINQIKKDKETIKVYSKIINDLKNN